VGELSTDIYDFTLDTWSSVYAKNQSISSKLEPSPIRPFGAWYEHTFEKQEKQKLSCSIISWFGIFAVRKEDILKRPKCFYESLLSSLISPNPEVGHYIERSWAAIFQTNNICDARIKIGS
jgi:hypothetical protein